MDHCYSHTAKRELGLNSAAPKNRGPDHSYSNNRENFQYKDHSYFQFAKKTPPIHHFRVTLYREKCDQSTPIVSLDHTYVRALQLCQISAHSDSPEMPLKYELIITADDMGYCVQRDNGIFECYQSGAVTQGTVLINGASAEYAVTKAKELFMPLGLHLNITEGSPVSPVEEVPSLVNESGFFLGKFGFREALSKGNICPLEVSKEIEAQLIKFKQLAGHLPQHVDGHQHAHILPGIREVFASVVSDFDIHWTRLSAECLQHADWLDTKSMSFFKSVVEDSLASKKVFASRNIRSTDAFIGMTTMGKNMTVQRLKDALSDVFELKNNRHSNDKLHQCITDQIVISCELMVHPGYKCQNGGCGEGPDDFSQSEDRPHEMEIVQSEKLREFFKENRIHLTAYQV